MAWFNLTPTAKVAFGAIVADGIAQRVSRARREATSRSPSQRRAMAKIILESPWAVGKSDEELIEFCRNVTDDQFINMFGYLPKG